MYGARIGSRLEFTGATLSNPDGAALRAPGLRVGSDMHCGRRFTATGAIDCSQRRSAVSYGWAAPASAGVTATATPSMRPLLKVDGGMYCNAGFHAIGRVNLSLLGPSERLAKGIILDLLTRGES